MQSARSRFPNAIDAQSIREEEDWLKLATQDLINPRQEPTDHTQFVVLLKHNTHAREFVLLVR